MMKIAKGYQKDPFTGRMLYPGEMYEEIGVQPEKIEELTEPEELMEPPEELKENGKPKRVKKAENE